MGLKDKLKEAANKAIDATKDAISNELYGNNDVQMHNRSITKKTTQFGNLTKTKLHLTSGNNTINQRDEVTFYQKDTGEVFFNLDDSKLYKIIEYSWSGAVYKTITNSKTLSEELKRGKSGKVIIGGLVGATINPFGAVIGAGAGALGKGKKMTTSNTSSISEQLEINTPATIKLLDIKTNRIFGLGLVCNSYIDSEIKKFALASDIEAHSTNSTNEENENLKIDPYEEIKKAKELLDMEIITQVEFDIKKKELLGL